VSGRNFALFVMMTGSPARRWTSDPWFVFSIERGCAKRLVLLFVVLFAGRNVPTLSAIRAWAVITWVGTRRLFVSVQPGPPAWHWPTASVT